jgi:hypothetical protein
MTTTEQLAWRPQAFGRRNAKQIDDPVIEPLWLGDRAIATIAAAAATLLDTAGDPMIDRDEEIAAVIAALTAAIRAEQIVVDGYLTRQAIPDQPVSLLVGADIPSAGQMASQFLVGRGVRARRMLPDEKAPGPSGTLAFVAIDLLSLDGESLLEIPLLERRRLLESVLAEGDLVRRTAYVRPPVDVWLASWRSLGFRELAYKAANSRYRPGVASEDWAIARIPTT